MDFSLSSSLVGNAVLSADKLALDLQFAADKTLTARKGPTPVFTRASTGRFVGSNGLIQSAAINGPRFDHDPVTGVCKGLLMEESRTNTLLLSESFDSASWAVTGKNLTVTADAVLSPSGLLNADKLTVGATTTTYLVIQGTPAFVSGTTHTVSCFFKADQVTRVALYATTTATFPANAIFDLTGSGSVVQNTFGIASITPYANGWYRCQITGTAGASVPTSIRISPVTGTSLNYVGNSIDSFYAWGAQLELGSFPTSYIPTTTASVVRSADVCSITGSAFTALWNPLEGSLFASGTGRNYVVMASGATNANQIAFLRNISPKYLRWDIANNGNYTAQVASQIVTEETFIKSAGSYASNDARAAFNGTLGTQDLTVTIPSLIALNIGSASGGGQQLNGTIGAVRYYRKPLSNSRLQAITV